MEGLIIDGKQESSDIDEGQQVVENKSEDYEELKKLQKIMH